MRPVVFTATRPATEQARRLGLLRCLENCVEEGLALGRVVPESDGSATVLLDEDVRVRVRPVRSKLGSKRRGWQPVEVRRGPR